MSTSLDTVVADLEQHLAAWACDTAGMLPRGEGIERIDAHCHSGVDSDGSTLTLGELSRQLSSAAIDRALVAPLHHPNGYAQENPRLVAEIAEYGAGRMHALWRIDPHGSDPARDAAAGMDAGAAGIKLHPRAERFSLDHPGVRAAVEAVGEAGGAVLVHAGRGMPQLGHEAVALARRTPGATIILAHAAISDLAWLADDATDVENLAFDTSWWLPADVAALLRSFPRHRVVFGSDPPYGTVQFGMIMAARIAITSGWSLSELVDLFGGTIRRVLGEEGAHATNPVWTAPALRHGIDTTHLDRAHRYLASAIYASLHGGDPAEMLELTRHALALRSHHEYADDALQISAMIAVAEQLMAQPHRSAYWRSGLECALHALIALATPEIGVPIAPASGVA